MGHIQRKHRAQSKVAIPPPGVLADATKTIDPLLERRITNSLQIRQLSTLRDALLPRLISGKLRLQDAPAAEEAMA
jgi:type I restriction enzyme S subunit